ncbi:unnamed protein product [Moneuplotes crassus]|uniref:Uncharacterized protein n=1 Tax=Euplotes crassus TaxID=5936 RepID=A0AAD1XWN3_EUPCR|nr:unnamed protein product [Moneuplotes crassus]
MIVQDTSEVVDPVLCGGRLLVKIKLNAVNHHGRGHVDPVVGTELLGVVNSGQIFVCVESLVTFVIIVAEFSLCLITYFSDHISFTEISGSVVQVLVLMLEAPLVESSVYLSVVVQVPNVWVKHGKSEGFCVGWQNISMEIDLNKVSEWPSFVQRVNSSLEWGIKVLAIRAENVLKYIKSNPGIWRLLVQNSCWGWWNRDPTECNTQN